MAEVRREGCSLAMRTSAGGLSASLASVFEVLGTSGHLLKRFAEFFPDLIDAEGPGLIVDLSADRGDLFRIKSVASAADGAFKLIFEPSDRYIKFVAAISRDGNVSADFDLHGWPILSVVSAQPTVAEGGGARHPVLNSRRAAPGGQD